jgi:serine/threonine-protein kinase
MSHTPTGGNTWIDELADRFESDWKRGGERPRIADYLAGTSAPHRALLLVELIRVECELRRNAGETPAPAEYYQQLPEDHAAVDAAFGDKYDPEPVPRPPQVTAAESLLFGLLALQNNFIDRDALLAAFSAWVTDKSQSLGKILLDRGALSAARHAVLAELVQEHLDQHGRDPERSLAVLAVGPAVREQLEHVPDLDLQASLLYLGLATTDEGGDQGESTASWDDESSITDAEGHFRIVRFHDRGGLGEVYVARDQQLHRIVALKRIKLDHATDHENKARFVVEAEITGRLEHPGIVPVYGLGTFDDGRPFYAMRFIRGDNLKSAIKQFHEEEDKSRDPGERTLALQKLLRRFLDVCNAIDYAHSRGVLHRDLKPGNIMLGKFGETLVVDWGLAKSLGRSEGAQATATLDERTLIPHSGSDLRGTEFGARLGTPAYMSPEQAAGRIDALGPASDVYSLGATLYCLLTGKAPFDDTDIAELLHKVERGGFSPPRKVKGWIDPALEAICLKAMATDPARRYRTPRALADDVEHWLADEPVSARPELFADKARRWAKRNRTAVTGAVVALVAGVIGLSTVLAVQTRANAELAAANRRVEQRYTLALEAIKTFHTGVSEDVLLKNDNLKPLRDRLLKDAARFYERLGGQLSGQPDRPSRRALGHALTEMAGLAAKIGAMEQAIAGYRQALAVRRGLAEEVDADREAKAEVPRSLIDLGVALSGSGRTDEARASFEEARTLLEGRTSADLTVTQFQGDLARCDYELGLLLENTGKRKESMESLQAGLEIFQRLADANPGVIEFQVGLAKTRRIVGFYLYEFGKPKEAMAVYQAGRLTLQRLVNANPEVTEFQNSLARMYNNMGNTQKDTGDGASGLAFYQAARNIYQNLVDANPAVTDFQNSLGMMNVNMGIALKEIGKLDEAHASLNEARAILQRVASANPTDSRTQDLLKAASNETGDVVRLEGRPAEARPFYEAGLAYLERLSKAPGFSLDYLQDDLVYCLKGLGATQKAAGQAADAVATWRRAVTTDEKIGTTYPVVLYNLAGCHALLGGIAGTPGSGLSAAEGAAELDKAMVVLRRAVASSYRNLNWIRRDPDLEPLRARPDFQTLTLDLAFPSDPFANSPEAFR